MATQFLIATDQCITASSLTDCITGDVINTATGTAQMYDMTDTAVGDSISFTATGSDGDYAAALTSATTVLLAQFQTYYLETVFVSGTFFDTTRIYGEANYQQQ